MFQSIMTCSVDNISKDRDLKFWPLFDALCPKLRLTDKFYITDAAAGAATAAPK